MSSKASRFTAATPEALPQVWLTWQQCSIHIIAQKKFQIQQPWAPEGLSKLSEKLLHTSILESRNQERFDAFTSRRIRSMKASGEEVAASTGASPKDRGNQGGAASVGYDPVLNKNWWAHCWAEYEVFLKNIRKDLVSWRCCSSSLAKQDSWCQTRTFESNTKT